MNSRLKISLAVLLGALAVLLLVAGSAGAAAKPRKLKTIHPPAKVRVGRVALAQTSSGRDALLVAVRYPIQAVGRVMTTSVKLSVPGGRSSTDVLSARVSAGDLRRPDRRRKFVFVHEVDLSRAVTESIEAAAREGRAAKVRVSVDGRIDVDDDGVPELTSHADRDSDPACAPDGRRPRRGSPRPPATRARRPGSKRSAATSRRQIVAPKSETTIPLPACTVPMKWSVLAGSGSGTGPSATISGGALHVKTGAALGTERVKLNGATAVLKVTQNAGEEAPPAAGPDPARSSARWATRSPRASATTATAR